MTGIRFLKKQWIIVILIGILFFMVLGLNSRLAEYLRLTGQREEMEDRINNIEATSVVLETQIAYAESEKAVEEWARTYERMGQPGDQLIIPLPLGEFTPEVKYLETPTPASAENWQIWWALIFGD